MLNIYENSLDLFTPDKQRVSERVEIDNVNDPRIEDAVGEQDAAKLREDLELIEGVYPPGLLFHTLGHIHNYNDGIDGSERAICVFSEILVTGSVKNVYLLHLRSQDTELD